MYSNKIELGGFEHCREGRVESLHPQPLGHATDTHSTRKILSSPRFRLRNLCGLMGSIMRRTNDLGCTQGVFWQNIRSRKGHNWNLENLKVEDLLGQGSFGVVFKVKARDDGFSAAIKCIKKNVVNTEKELSRVKAEFSCWRAMSEHPHVISLFAFLETDRHWCFVMEREDFGSLSQILRSEDVKLSSTNVRKIAAQLAHAISTLHHAGYLHRDISCSNVLLTERLDCRLIDFGLSVKGTSASNRCGSLAYMAPEVLDKKTATCAADWWSYGIIVYAMMVGKTPLSLYAIKKQLNLGAMPKDARYELAKKAPITISSQLDSDSRTLLADILRSEPEARLGARDGMNFDLVKSHRYFDGVDWTDLDRAKMNILRRIEIRARNNT